MFRKMLHKLHKIDWMFYFFYGFIQVGRFHKSTHQKFVGLTFPGNQELLSNFFKKVRFYRIVYFIFELFYIVTFIGLTYAISFGDVNQYIFVFVLNSFVYGILMGIGNYIQDSCFLYVSILMTSLKSYINSRNLGSELYSRKDKLYDAFIKTFTMERFSHIWILLIIFSGVSSYFINIWYGVSWYFIVLIIILNILFIFGYLVFMESIYSDLQSAIYNAETTLKNHRVQNIGLTGSYKKILLEKVRLGTLTAIKVFANTYVPIVIIIFSLLFMAASGRSVSFQDFLLFMSLTTYIDGKVYTAIRTLADILSYRKNLFIPLLHKLEHEIPSPLSQNFSMNKVPEKFALLRISNLNYKINDNDKSLLNIPDLQIPVNKGSYIVIGDSGEGKSLFMQLLGNQLYPTTGNIELIDQTGNAYNIHQSNYWQTESIISYVWVSNTNIEKSTPVQLFRPRLIKTERSDYISKIIKDTCRLSDKIIQSNFDFITNSVQKARTSSEERIDRNIEKFLSKYLFETELFRSNESHIMHTPIDNLSGGQQARLMTAYYLSGSQKILLFDETLERTTSSFDEKNLYTRERLINFISKVNNESDQLIFLLTQGGKKEHNLLKKSFKKNYLGSIEVKNGLVYLSK